MLFLFSIHIIRNIWGPIHEANIQQFLSSVSYKTKLQCIFFYTLKKYDLQKVTIILR